MAVKSSGLSTQQRSAPPTPDKYSETDAYTMPMEQLRELADRQLREQQNK